MKDHYTKKVKVSFTRWLTCLFFLMGIWTTKLSAITVFTQNFESAWTTAASLSPAWSSVITGAGDGNNNWQRNDFTTGWTGAGSCGFVPTGANGTSFSARVHVFDAPSGTGGDMITPVIDCSVGAATKQLSFFWSHTSGGALFNVFVSTDGGATYGASVFSATFNAAGWIPQTINLGSLTSSTVKLKFSMTNSNFNCADFWLDEVNLIDLAPCATPPSQPTSLLLNPASPSVITGTFTPAVGADGYLIVRYPTGATPTNPVDLTSYSTGNPLGTGTVVASTSSTSFSATGLTLSTTYDFYVYAQNFACVGGPLYLAAAPITATATTPAFITASVLGGLWNNAATWGGAIPTSTENVVIPAGAIVSIDVAPIVNNITVNGTLQWAGGSVALTCLGNLQINAGGKFYGFSSAGTGQTINILGNLVNDGYANLALSGLQFAGSGAQSIGGSGTFQGNGTRALVAGIMMQGSGTLNIGIPLNVRTLTPLIGTITNASNIEFDNTKAQIFNQAINSQINNVIVTNMGSGYTTAPVAFGSAVTAWSAITGALNTLYYSGVNVYRCTAAASIGASAPVHTSGITDNLLWIGNLGTIGNAFLGAQSHTAGTQYFYGGNLYTCSVTGAALATAPPVHLSGVVASGAASFQFVGTVATISLNYDAVNFVVRSATITSVGSGYANGSPSIVVTNTGAGASAAIVSLGLPAVAGSLTCLLQKNPLALLSGAPTINSTQGISIPTTTTGGRYAVAPTVFFQAPSAVNYITLAGADGGVAYTVTPTSAAFTGGSNNGGTNTFTITVSGGKVIGLVFSGTALWSAPPTGITFTGGSAGTLATGPTSGSLSAIFPTATANLNANGQLTNFTVGNPGGRYIVAPTIALSVAAAGEIAAATPTCRVNLYNLALSFFGGQAINGVTPVTVNAAHNESTNAANCIPANRRINTLTSSFSQGFNLTGGNLTLYNSTPLTFGGTVTVCPLDLGGSELTYEHFTTTGVSSTGFCWVQNGSIVNNHFGTAAAGGTKTFAFRATGATGAFQLLVGSGTAPVGGSNINRVRVTQMGAPSGVASIVAPVVTLNMGGTRAFKVDILAGTTFGATTIPTAVEGWDASDNLISDNPSLYLAQSNTNLTSGWAARTAAGTPGTLTATGTRTTATTINGPIVFAPTMYFGWAVSTAFVVPPPLDFVVVRTTSNTYSSIASVPNGGDGSGTLSTASGDEGNQLVAFTGFSYQGSPVTGFVIHTNGLIALNNGLYTYAAAANWDNTLGGTSVGGTPDINKRNILAPFYDDLNKSGAGFGIYHKIVGNVATIEWYNTTFFGLSGPQMFYQIVLDGSDNSITYNYGNMQLFNGTQNIRYAYTCGLSGSFVQSPAQPGQIFQQQYENTAFFTHENSNIPNRGANGLSISPEPRSRIKFTPGTYVPIAAPSATPPANDEFATAITRPALTSFPANIAWDNGTNTTNLYTTRFATHSTIPDNGCATSPTNKDAWFKFNANNTDMTVRVYASGGYIARVQVYNQLGALLSPAVCNVGTQGLITNAVLSGLTLTEDYYVRVSHDLTGVSATATATVSGGLVSGLSIVNGTNYSVPAQAFGYFASNQGPRITFTGGGGSGAVASLSTPTSPTQVLATMGAANITFNGGAGYTSAPTVTIESPDWGITGEFGIIVFAVAANDTCATAINLTNTTNTSCVLGQNSLETVSTAAAPITSNTAPAAILGTTADDDVWYKFTGAVQQTVVSVSGFATYDPAVQVYTGTCTPGGLTLVTESNATFADEDENLNFATTVQTYFVRVYHAGVGAGSPGSNFNICAYQFVPAVNDVCASAIALTPQPLTCTTPTAGSNIGGTPSSPALAECTGNADDDVWYYFDATGTDYRVTLQSFGTHDGVLAIYDAGVSPGACPSLPATIACEDIPGAGGTETFTAATFIPGNRYYIRVYHFGIGTGTGLFNICVVIPDIVAPAVTNIIATPATSGCTPTSHSISADVTDANGLASVNIVWSLNAVPQANIPMVLGVPPNYSATIPAQGNNAVSYTIVATDIATPTANVTNAGNASYQDGYLNGIGFSAGADQLKNIGSQATLTATYTPPAGAAGCLKITEITLFKTGTGFTPTYPVYAVGDDILEITNTGTNPTALGGLHLKNEGNRNMDYIFPAATVPAGGVVIVNFGIGTDDIPNLAFFTGAQTGSSADQWSSGTDNGIWITQANGTTVIDAVATNSHLFSGGSGVTALDWSGAGATGTGGHAGTRLTGADVNSATNWVTAGTSTQNQGTVNAGVPLSCNNSVGGYTVTWTGGNLLGPTVGDVILTPAYIAPPQLFTYTATLTDGFCNVADNMDVTTQFPIAPVANFSVNSQAHTIGTTVSTAIFTDLSTNIPDTWTWNITGPGAVNYVNATTAASQNPQVQFTLAGVYTVALTVVNGGGNDTKTEIGYITVTALYCASNATSTADEEIYGVVFAGINNNSNCGTTGGPGSLLNQYSNYLALTPGEVAQGYTFPFTLNTSACGTGTFSAGYSVFIDFNQDGDFVDLNEKVLGSVATTPIPPGSPAGSIITTFTGNVTIPLTATVGPTRMRIVLTENNATPTSCLVYGFGETEDYTININAQPVTPPACPTGVTVNNVACITATSISWTAATGFPQGYYVYVGTDGFGLATPIQLLGGQDVGNTLSVTLPLLDPATLYYYEIASYNNIGENTTCSIGSFNSGASTTQTPTQSPASYTETMDNGVVIPALPCGVTSSNENFPIDAFTWYTDNTFPNTGTRHLRIDKNTDNTTAKDDWFYSAPMNLTAGKLYRIYFRHALETAGSETFELFLSNASDAATMLTTSAVFNGSSNLLTYKLDSSADLLPLTTGVYYYGFHATGAANGRSLFMDDIQVRQIPVAALDPGSCTTIPSLYDQLLVQAVYGAQDYKFKIENLANSFSYEYTRNLAIPDFRLKWAPGVVYGLTYDVSVSYKKNNVWSPYGASCPVTMGPFPMTQLRGASCGAVLTDQYTQLYIDSVGGANDYEYRIVQNTLVYDHTWMRGAPVLDYRLYWAYQYTPSLVERIPFGFTYDVQVRALVGRTGPAQGNLPGVFGTFGPVCTVTLAGQPQTQLVALAGPQQSCGKTLVNITDQIFCIPVVGAGNYRYHVVNVALGYDVLAYRNSSLNDYRLSWLPTVGGIGLRYSTTYDITVSDYVGGVWSTEGNVCQVTTPASPLTQLQVAYCPYTLPTFSTTVYCDAVPAATDYRYHITGPASFDRTVQRNSPGTDFKFSWSLVCCGGQNMAPNTAYQVEVASYAGGVWSAYGTVCTVTTGASVPRYSPFLAEEGMNESSASLSLSVYPNPAAVSEEYSIELTGIQTANANIELDIYNMLGEKVYRSVVITKEESRMILKPEQVLAPGVYMVEARFAGNVYREKFVVK